MKQVVIEIPDDKEVQWIDNVLTLVDKEPKVEIKTYDDLINNEVKISGYYTAGDSINELEPEIAHFANKDVATSEKIAKSMLAMAQISQLMPYYGGEISESDWDNQEIRKYYISKNIDITTNCMNICRGETVDDYYFLAFYSRLQRDLFLENNGQLVYDYLMYTEH